MHITPALVRFVPVPLATPQTGYSSVRHTRTSPVDLDELIPEHLAAAGIFLGRRSCDDPRAVKEIAEGRYRVLRFRGRVQCDLDQPGSHGVSRGEDGSARGIADLRGIATVNCNRSIPAPTRVDPKTASSGAETPQAGGAQFSLSATASSD
jgi:hypothetical protein